MNQSLPESAVSTSLTHDKRQIKRFRSILLKWHERSRRSFPWRDTSDPYAILIAEVLLQKTKAGPVLVQTYNEIISRYPTVLHLYKADFSDLMKLMRPLGLPRRVKCLRLVAKELVESHNSKVPSTLDGLRQLYGVGEYSARAILSFAFSYDTPTVDINSARFFYRFLGIDVPFPKTPTRNKNLLRIAARYVPRGHSREFNYALLDFCSTVCTPRRPSCKSCPIALYCRHDSALGSPNLTSRPMPESPRRFPSNAPMGTTTP